MEKFRQNRRIVWADYCKFFAISCMVLGHVDINETFRTFIYMFHMPIFFFISGYFEKGRDIVNTIKNIVRTLYIPYLFFSFFSFLWCWISPILHPELYPDIHSVKQIFLSAFIGIFLMDDTVKSFAFLPNGPLWFLVALIIIKIIFSFLYFIAKYVGRKCEVLFWILVIGWAIISFVELRQVYYFSIDSAMMGLPFYIMGFLLKQTSIIQSYVKYSWWGMAISFIYLIIGGVKNGYADMDGGIYGKSLIAFYLNAIIGICFLISISMLCSKYPIKLVQFIGENTLVVLAFHGLIILCLKGLGMFILHVSIPPIVNLLIVLIICIPLALFFSKYLPIAIGRRSS